MSAWKTVAVAMLVGFSPLAMTTSAVAADHGHGKGGASAGASPQVQAPCPGYSAPGMAGMGGMAGQHPMTAGMGQMGMGGPGMPAVAGMMGPGMMGPGMMMGGPMMGRGGDSRVTPIEHLSVADVTHFFEHRLDEAGNDRLKLGKVEEVDGDWISVEIVTVDDSLVDRLRVDRHSGLVSRPQ